MTTDNWTGTNVTKARDYIRPRLPMPCTLCGNQVTNHQAWVVAHLVPRWQRPDLALVPSNWGADHRSCSDKSGQHNALTKAHAAGAAGLPAPVLRGAPTRTESPPLTSSTHKSTHDVEILPTNWPETVGSLPWMAELAPIPDEGTAPRYMTGPHPQAVGTYGPEFVIWCDEHATVNPKRSEGLRWWQQVVAYRILEHDKTGRLVWRNVLITMARQVGKSWFVRMLILWRIQQEEMFGEVQTCIHVAHRMPTANEVWRPAARWAMGQHPPWLVRWGAGDQVIESPEGGRWLVKAATDGVGVGFALTMLVADEGWMIARSVIEAADPALTEAESPQLVLISTAGDSSSDLFGTYRAQALDQVEAPGNTLVVEWSAPKDLAIDDPVTWRLASPWWSTRRENEILDKVGKLEELEFRQNYLNQWVDQAHGRVKEPGLPVFAEGEWFELNDYKPGAPGVAAVESWFGEGLAVATAENLGAQVGVSVQLVASTVEAAALLGAMSPRPGIILAGKSLVSDPALLPFGVRGVGSTSKSAVTELRRLVDEDVLRHDSSPALAEQVLGLRTVPGADGPRVRSVGRMDAVKAVVFAAEELRANAGVAHIW